MAKNVLCPVCLARNAMPPGVVGIHCIACGNFIHAPTGTNDDWGPAGRVERWLAYFSTPKGIAITSVVLLVVFAGFWLLLQAILRPAAPPTPPVAQIPTPPTGSDHIFSTPVVTPEQPAPSVSTSPAPPAIVKPVVRTLPTKPVPHELPFQDSQFNDQLIAKAIIDASHFLVGQIDPDTGLIAPRLRITSGVNALALYALLQANDAVDDPEISPDSPTIKRAIDALKAVQLDPTIETYTRSLRANALALLNRPEDRSTLAADVAYLIAAEHAGAYGYNNTPNSSAPGWDNSNSQYGLLGVWAGTEVGIPVAQNYWENVTHHWEASQNSDGGFYYNTPGSSSLSMTAAGVASLCIAHDDLSDRSSHGIDPRPKALLKAIHWLSAGDNLLLYANGDSHFTSYTLYGVARAGLASNYKYFGKHDWYSELGKYALSTRRPDGSFGDQIDTSFIILFLARGRHPVAMNKLVIDGTPSAYLRDMANFSHYLSHQLEHTFNAQIVPLDVDWTQWTDAPIVYLSAQKAPDISDEQVTELRNFALAGGLVLANAERNSPDFTKFASALAARMFPEYKLDELPPQHPIYRALYKITDGPKLKAVSNGVRVLYVVCPQDLSQGWDKHDWNLAPNEYHLGMNLFLYAAGARDFRNRLDTSYVALPTAKPEAAISVARLMYDGDWNPEPYAWTRFASVFQWHTSFALNVSSIPIAQLAENKPELAVLTGVGSHQFTSEQLLAMRDYVQHGGTLLIDSTGSAPGFAASQAAIVQAMASGGTELSVDDTCPVINGVGPGMDALPKPLPRDPTHPVAAPQIIKIGSGHLIVTPADLTDGLLGMRTFGMTGFSDDYAWRFVKNLLLWKYNGQPDTSVIPASGP